jgi:hypothetical protein
MKERGKMIKITFAKRYSEHVNFLGLPYICSGEWSALAPIAVFCPSHDDASIVAGLLDAAGAGFTSERATEYSL